MNYLPVCFTLMFAILYIVTAVPPSFASKAACVALGIALAFFGYLAGNGSGVPWEDELEGKGGPPPADPDAAREKWKDRQGG